MKYFLLFLSVCILTRSYSQQNCLKNSKLYYFDPSSSPRIFTEKLGNHPEFPFLQQIHGVTTTDEFIESINNPDNQKKYAREFIAFDLLLRNSGFTNGYKDLSDSNVENMYVKRGTIGNLGFYDPQHDRISYIYVKLNPAGEEKSGVAAWKLTTAKGCYLYILHTCGNAFYPNTSPKNFGGKSTKEGSCKMVDMETLVRPTEIKTDSFDRKLHVTINFYQAELIKHHGKYDTIVRLAHKTDTTTSFKDRDGKQYKIYANTQSKKILVCKDTTLSAYMPLLVDSSVNPTSHDPIDYVFSDTAYIKPKTKPACNNKLEISLDGGISFNSIPRFNNPTQHSQTDGSHLAGEFAISQIFVHWFQAGISASYFILAYQDDIAYPGSTPGTYNKITLGKPIIPIQLFGKFTFGKEVGWQSTLALALGYAIPMKGSIQNNGNTLTTDPALQGAPTAGIRLGIAYFFSCHFGMGVTTGGQYFGNKGALMKYSLFALPVTGGIKIRF